MATGIVRAMLSVGIGMMSSLIKLVTRSTGSGFRGQGSSGNATPWTGSASGDAQYRRVEGAAGRRVNDGIMGSAAGGEDGDDGDSFGFDDEVSAESVPSGHGEEEDILGLDRATSGRGSRKLPGTDGPVPDALPGPPARGPKTARAGS